VTAAGGGASAGAVSHALARVGGTWQHCYDMALASGAGGTGAGNATMRLACDSQGRVLNATMTGFELGDVASCIGASARGVTIPNADTGDAWANLALTFTVLP
jgi:hypothetical protein